MEGYQLYIALFFALLGVASAVARLTPNPKDDRLVSKIWEVVNRLGLRGGPTD